MKTSELIEALIDGSISETQFEDLKRRLANDAEAREQYVAQMEVEALLTGSRPAHQPAVTLPVESSPTRMPNWIVTGMALMALAAICGGLIFLMSQPTGDREQWASEDSPVLPDAPPQETLPIHSVARLTNGKNFEWASERKIPVGDWLYPANYELARGRIEITFDSGATVSVAGKSAFEIVGPNELHLLRGSLQAKVPEHAIGFTVNTPSGQVVDLSTEFGVRVSPNGESSVHVLKGLVEARPSSAQGEQTLTLKENSAIRMFPEAPPQPIEFSPKKLVELGSRGNRRAVSYVHFSFDEPEVADGIVKNQGTAGDGAGGTMLGGDSENSWLQVDGRFGKSLYLAGTGAKVATSIKGIEGNQPRTVMFWARINPTTPTYNAYSFVSWGNSKAANGRKWQIGWNTNRLGFCGLVGAIRTEFGGGFVTGSVDLRDGRWHHIASVFIGSERDADVSTQIRHYVDGKLDTVSGFRRMEIQTASSGETLTLGQYINPETYKGRPSYFVSYKGWIDEFYMFDAALTPSQIVQVMEQNKPPAAAEILPPAAPGL